jgi:N-acetylglucosamine-6-sulfatase
MRGRRSAAICCFMLAWAVAPGRPAPWAGADPPGQPPNIVLIVTDDQTLDTLAAMPFLTSKPGGHWIEFTNAFLNTPLCCPTRATLLTGLYAHHHGVTEPTGGDFDETSTLATWLQSAGYRTGLAGKYLNGYPFSEPPYIPPGWSEWYGNVGTLSHYNHQMYENGTLVSYGQTASDYQTDVVARKADAFIRSAGAQPFFFYAAPYAPHEPLIPPPRYANIPVSVTRPPSFNEADVSDKPAWVKAKPLLTNSQALSLDQERRKRHRMVMAIDDLVRTVYLALEATSVLGNTVIIVQSDNGYVSGEHRLQGAARAGSSPDKTCVYEECVRTPMFVRFPAAVGRLEPKLVSSVDIAPTVADIAGVVPLAPMDGTSLVPLIHDSGRPWRSGVLIEFAATTTPPPFWAIRTLEWKYAELDTGERELYDVVTDPYEMENRAGQAGYEAIQAGLAEQLETLRTAPPTPALPSLSIDDVTVTEGATGLTEAVFTISLTAPSNDPVTVAFETADGTATAPPDYESTSGEATLAPGETSTTISVNVVGDEDPEPDESFTVELSAPVGAVIADPSGTARILTDDGASTVSIDDVSIVEGNSGTTNATFTVTLTPASVAPATVSYTTTDGSAVAPADYAADSGILTFDPSETTKTISVSVTGDVAFEPTETFSVDIASPELEVVDAQGVGTILNDDTMPSIAIADVSTTEGTGAPTIVSFVVTLSTPSAVPVTVGYATANGIAKAPGDYGATSGTLTFDPGETTKTIQVSIVGDALSERAETFDMNLSGANGATIADPSGRCTIQNDD